VSQELWGVVGRSQQVVFLPAYMYTRSHDMMG
jgi:hypothetical protein